MENKMSFGYIRAAQIKKGFNQHIEKSQSQLLKSWGYDDSESIMPIILNNGTVDQLIKGKLNTSHLVLKEVSVNGKMQHRWVDPNKNNQEHAEHGSTVEFEHKGEKKKGTVGSVIKTGEYAIHSGGKIYNKHPHQFASPHIEDKLGNHAANTDTEKLQKFASKAGVDPKLKEIAEKEITKRNQSESGGGDSDYSGTEPSVSSEQTTKLDDEGDEDQDINAKFKTYEKFVRMTAKGLTKSTIAYGGGGVGKTYTAVEQLKKMINPATGKPFVFYNSKEHEMGSSDYDVVKVTGRASTAGLYKTMYQHNDKLLLFDDCDEVLADKNSVNMFKGALDSTGDGTINNLTGSPIKDDKGDPIPQTYTFSGRAIFISNLTPEKMPQPLKSRSLRIDLSMDADQTIDRIKHISKGKDDKLTNMKLTDVAGKPIKYTHEDMDKAIKFMEKHKNKMSDINVRTLGSLVKIIHDDQQEGEDNDDWQTTAKHMIFSKGLIVVTENDIEKSFKQLNVL